MHEHHQTAFGDLKTKSQLLPHIYIKRADMIRKMPNLVECMVDKEAKEATHVPHNCQDQQQSGSEYCPVPTTIM